MVIKEQASYFIILFLTNENEAKGYTNKIMKQNNIFSFLSKEGSDGSIRERGRLMHLPYLTCVHLIGMSHYTVEI